MLRSKLSKWWCFFYCSELLLKCSEQRIATNACGLPNSLLVNVLWFCSRKVTDSRIDCSFVPSFTRIKTRRWQLKHFLFSPLPGEIIQFWRAYFSDGLVTSKHETFSLIRRIKMATLSPIIMVQCKITLNERTLILEIHPFSTEPGWIPRHSFMYTYMKFPWQKSTCIHVVVNMPAPNWVPLGDYGREGMPCQKLFLVPLNRWDRWYIITPNSQYIPLIVLAFWGDYMLPIPHIKGTRLTTIWPWYRSTAPSDSPAPRLHCIVKASDLEDGPDTTTTVGNQGNHRVFFVSPVFFFG